jgi:peptide-methionine (S)-S-oxide reductase
MQIATFAGGCFWCVEAILQDIKGVQLVESGYSNGDTISPTYKDICTGTTGHAEVVRVIFDPEIVSFEDLCLIFFTTHDPTTLNRQGADVGTQYRSAIFYHTEEQKIAAESMKVEAQKFWEDPIVTEITAADTFYKAEDYHQNYFKTNPYQGYCQIVVAPKVRKFRKEYADRLK